MNFELVWLDIWSLPWNLIGSTLLVSVDYETPNIYCFARYISFACFDIFSGYHSQALLDFGVG